MPQLMISGKRQAPSLRRHLDRHIAQLAGEGVGVAINERHIGEYTHYTCTLVDQAATPLADAMDEMFRSIVAQAVAEAIVRDIAPTLVIEEVKGLKPEYDDADVAHVLALAERAISQISNGETLSGVAQSVLDYLWEQESLNIEGFVRFRLPSYRKRLQECVRDAVRRFESAREQQEFIKLLRYLVEHQESSIDELHIYPDSGNSFEMRDQNGSSIDSDYLEAYVWDLANEGGVDREDLLISAVVSLAPMKVCWHLDHTAWKSQMLEKILQDRLNYCTGCDHCAPTLH